MDFVSQFHVEAKTFEFSVVNGASVLRLEERRRGLSSVMFLGKLCIDWLITMVEALVRNLEASKFIKSFQEGSKAFLAQRGANGSGQFLQLAVHSVGGRRGLILVSEGRGAGVVLPPN